MLLQGFSLVWIEIEEEKQKRGGNASSWAISFGQTMVRTKRVRDIQIDEENPMIN